MKGIVLAGGQGTRLHPLTVVTNKHLLPVFDRPMIHYAIGYLVAAGITDVLIVTSGNHVPAFRNLLRDGTHLGVARLEYACQHRHGGIAHALALAESFADGDKSCVILGDNIIEGGICKSARIFERQPTGARLLLKSVEDATRFGVAVVRGGTIVRINEKPVTPESDLAVTGIYFYDADVYSICRSLTPSSRGELEITDVNNTYLRRGDLTFDVLDGWWTDAGTFSSLLRASTLVADASAHQGYTSSLGARTHHVASREEPNECGSTK